MDQRARPSHPLLWTLLAGALVLAVAALFWHSLGTVIAAVIVDIFVAVVRLFLAIADFFPNPF